MKPRKSSNHLPKHFRTDTNEQFLSATLDQLIQKGKMNKINGYIGSRNTIDYKNENYYIPGTNSEENNLMPSCVIEDEHNNISFYKNYNDYINQLYKFGADTSNHYRLNNQVTFPWDPNICFDKLCNFREYYWALSYIPTIKLNELNFDTTLNDTVTIDNGFVFNSYQQVNPTITLYKGVTYKFKVNTDNYYFSIRPSRDMYAVWRENTYYKKNQHVIYKSQEYKCINDHYSELQFNDSNWMLIELSYIDNNNINNGTLTITINDQTPDYLYYLSDNDVDYGGMIIIKDQLHQILNINDHILNKTNSVINGVKLSNDMVLEFGDSVQPSQYRNKKYIIQGVGDSISLIPYEYFFHNDMKEYVTISKNSRDGNLWTRNNNWVHIDVIKQAYEYNDQVVVINHNHRAKRPIIEFDAGLKLFNHGTQYKATVDLIDDYTDNIFKNIETQEGYNIDGVDLQDGMLVLFTNETDVLYQNRIFQIKFINIDGKNIISLVQIPDSLCEINHVVFCKNGEKYYHKSLWLSESGWELSQEKQYTPLFSVYDANGIELSNQEYYNYSNFKGSRLFAYESGKYTDDILPFSINYQSIKNIGSVVFVSDFNIDTFNYKKGNTVITQPINMGFYKKYHSLTEYELINDITVSEHHKQHIILETTATPGQYSYNINVFNEKPSLNDFDLHVFINGRLMNTTDYDINFHNNDPYVTFKSTIELNKDYLSFHINTQLPKSNAGYYEIPNNLASNPENEYITRMSFSEISDHVTSIIENCPYIIGKNPGSNNIRDIKNAAKYGSKIIVNSLPLSIPLYHITSRHSIIDALDESKKEYSRFKRQFIDVSSKIQPDVSISKTVNEIISKINENKTHQDKFYFTCMLPYKGHILVSYILKNNKDAYFPFTHLDSDFNGSILVYLDGKLLTHHIDYTITNDGRVNITCDKKTGQELEIYVYETSFGCHIPATPSKLGLYPITEPKIIIDDSYLNPTTVIIGHDGSKTIAYNDYRDDLLLDLEKRIYNNIKINYNQVKFNIHDYVPGLFRDTHILYDSFYETIFPDFKSWTKNSSIEFTSNTLYDRDNEFTYNYRNSTDCFGNKVSGTWKALYLRAFDTITPHSTPWEMLGFGDKPTWWESVYGKAPYTRDNHILWEDLAHGKIAEPNNIRYDYRYRRHNLERCIPVDSFGKLLSPIQCNLISEISVSELDSDFHFGDGSPTEISWKNSSDFRFSLLKSIILNFPSMAFSEGFDVSRQKVSLDGNLLYNSNILTPKDIITPTGINDQITTHTSGLVNYIRDVYCYGDGNVYKLYRDNIKNLRVKLGVNLPGFISKDNIDLLFSEKDPSRTIPKENYKLFLNKSSTSISLAYSGVLIERVATGFSVSGYNEKQYFNYHPVIKRNNDVELNIGGISENFVEWESDRTYSVGQLIRHRNEFYRSIRFHTTRNIFDITNYVRLDKLPVKGGQTAYSRVNFLKQVSKLNYGTILRTVQEVVDFLYGYGDYLQHNGMSFDYYNNQRNVIENWSLSVKEFMLWTTVSRNINSAITLSPGASTMYLTAKNMVIRNLHDSHTFSIYDQQGNTIPKSEVSITRKENNVIEISSIDNKGIYGVNFDFIQYGHSLLFDDFTEFNDIVYNKQTGYYRPRLLLSGYITDNWDGNFDIPGFIYDQPIITTWEPWKSYITGDVVKYKEYYYMAEMNIHGSKEFDHARWTKTSKLHTTQLLPNIETEISQIENFYDLSTNNFNQNYEKYAQGLIGYTPREYLNNITHDPVSQYKIYQGFIKDKGTRSSISNLFNTMPSHNIFELHEEWALQTGRYGSVDNLQELELHIKDKAVEPYVIEITDEIKNHNPIVNYYKPSEIFKSKKDSQLPAYDKPFIFSNAGYVNHTHVDHMVNDATDILDMDIDNTPIGSLVWITNNPWDVVEQTITTAVINKVTVIDKSTLLLDITDTSFFNINQIIGLYNTPFNGFYKIKNISDNNISIEYNNKPIVNSQELHGNISTFVSQRYKTTTSVNLNNIQYRDTRLLWIDNYDNHWKVLEKNNNIIYNNEIFNKKISTNFSPIRVSLDVDDNDMCAIVGRSDDGNGLVYVYRRPSRNANYGLVQVLEPETGHGYGDYVRISSDNRYIIISQSTYNHNNTHNAGRVYIYKRIEKGNYILEHILHHNNPEVDDRFGIKTRIRQENDNIFLYILSTKSDQGKIHLYKKEQNSQWRSARDSRYKGVHDIYQTYYENDLIEYENTLYIANSTITHGTPVNLGNWSIINDIIYLDSFINGSEYDSESSIRTFDINQNGHIVLSLYNGHVYILSNINGRYTIINEFSGETTFGFSVAISDSFLSISSPSVYRPDDIINIYQYKNGSYHLIQQVDSPDWFAEGRYGNNLYINNNTLLVTSNSSKPEQQINFDGGSTQFDNNFTNITYSLYNQSTIDTYEFTNQGFIYSDTLTYTSNNNSNFSPISLNNNTNKFYYGTIQEVSSCNISSITKPTPYWQLKSEYKPVVDTSLIKTVDLYDKLTKQHKASLDFIDVFQNRLSKSIQDIITYTTFFDPATYTIGMHGNIDPGSAWLDEHIGNVWWDIRAAKFHNPYQGSALYSSSTWNKLIDLDSIHIYEWVESTLTPEEWDNTYANNIANNLNVSGNTKYGGYSYSIRKKYNPLNKSFTTYHYYWVRKKITGIEGIDYISVNDLEKLLSSPQSNGLPYIALISNNQFALYNCQHLLDNNTIMKIEYWDGPNNIQSKIHNEYALLSQEGTAKINEYIEQKWIDSLVGLDLAGQEVPDSTISESTRYGLSNSPRQSMFVDKNQAFEQVITSVNRILLTVPIIDLYDISPLYNADQYPIENENLYDEQIETHYDLSLVSTYNLRQAKITPIIVNGRIHSITINDPGFGYKVPPTITVNGTGTNALLQTLINEYGEVSDVLIISNGENFSDTDTLTVRGYSVLVKHDEIFINKWVIFERNHQNDNWNITKVQTYDVRLYWDYVDWYKPGYNQNITVNHTIQSIHDIYEKPINVGDLIKVNTMGSYGWSLISITNTNPLSYDLIGREKGTIQFSKQLYDSNSFNVNYDSTEYDINPYDMWPIIEIRFILDAIRTHLLINELSSEYNKIFFSSIQYALSERPLSDWVFKTSFINIKHTFGELEQPENYTTDKFTSYKKYIEEIKPYKTKIRNYIENYTKTDNVLTEIDDFDFAFNKNDNRLSVIYDDGELLYNDNFVDKNASWYNNIGYKITKINLHEQTKHYNSLPELTVQGDESAKLKVILDDNGLLEQVTVVKSNKQLLEVPKLYDQDSYEVPCSIVIDDSLVRSIKTKLSFNRTSNLHSKILLETIEYFIADENQKVFELEWPMMLDNRKIQIKINQREILGRYTYKNIIDNQKSYTRTKGQITITHTLHTGDEVAIYYYKDHQILKTSSDMNHYFYNPNIGQYSLNYLETHDGYKTKIKSTNINLLPNWGETPWMSVAWTLYYYSNDVDTYIFDGQTSYTLARQIRDNEIRNVYVNGIRIDDPQYGTGNQRNANAVLHSITNASTNYDHNNKTITLFISGYQPNIGDHIMIIDSAFDNNRDILSSYDNIITGNNLSYRTAVGLSSNLISVDGGNFQETNYSGPEELVSSTILDTLDIVVHHDDGGITTKWRQFTDILGNTHYKVITDTTTTVNDLFPHSPSIKIVDQNKCPNPTPRNPGIIFINGERIEYYKKDGDILTGLIRGTLGTGVPNITVAGSELQVQDSQYNSTYTDTPIIEKQTFTGNHTITLPYDVESIDEIDVYLGGIKLNKNDILMFSPNHGQDSPEGDILLNKGFYIHNLPEEPFISKSTIIINKNVIDQTIGQDIKIIKKTGSMWNIIPH